MAEEGTDGGATGGEGAGGAGDGANTDANTGTGGEGGDGDKTGGVDGDKTGGEGDKVTPDFVLPDEFKDKTWAEKVKSQDDLYKQIDNLNTLAGKKNAYPEADATPEQLNEYYGGLRPETAEVYDFGKDHPQPEVAKQFGEMLFNANVSEHQSKSLIPAYNEHQKNLVADATSAEGFEKIMTEKFGKDYDAVATRGEAAMKEIFKDDKEGGELFNVMPNKYTANLYKITEHHIKEIAALKEQYGAKEGGDDLHNQKGGTPPAGVDIVTQRTNMRQEIRDLEKGMHTADQKQALVDKLQATYTNRK